MEKNLKNTHIPKIVITGGPCAGKSSAQTFLVEKLQSIGYYPLFVPEAPTILINQGYTPLGGMEKLRDFQERVVDMIMRLEDEHEEKLRAIGHSKPILVCDRGIMDAKAYMPGEMFWEVTGARGLDLSTMRDRRYLAVFHLRTAALGAEEYYTLENNTARLEGTLDEARDADEKTLQAWVGHPHVAVIDNNGKTFGAKLELLWKKITRALGEPEPLEIERKFVIKPVDLTVLGVPHQSIAIEQVYVDPVIPDSVLRLRKREQRGAATHFETTKSRLAPGVHREEERFIDAHEYTSRAGAPTQGTRVLHKTRHCFVWKEQYFELDVFDAPHAGLTILEIELTHEHDSVHLPPWVEVIREVTHDHSFSNRSLAQIA